MRLALPHGPSSQPRGKFPAGLSALPFVLALIVAGTATAFIISVLWPRWPETPITPDAPPLPMVIGNVVFHVPPTAIRVKAQRQPGTHDRIDLVYRWPALTPAALMTKADKASADAIFVTVAALPAGTLPPSERPRAIYPRYAEPSPAAGPNGLVTVAFRQGSPYQDEDLLFDARAPDSFTVRCSRQKGPTPGTCLAERAIGNADVMLRFPRDWLDDWRAVAEGINRLMASWQADAG